MPSPHHHRCACCCSYSRCSCFSSSTPSRPPFSISDQLLQALTTQLLQSQSPSPSPPDIYSHQSLKSHNPLYQPPYPTHQQPKDQQRQQYHSQTDALLHSLLSRVAVLESSLPHLSTPSSHCPPPPRSSLASRPPSSSLSSRCSCSCCSCFSSSTPSRPPFSTSDQLLQALTTQLLLQSQSPSPSPPHIYSHQSLKSHDPLYQPPYPTHQQPKDQQWQQYHSQTDPLLHSLLFHVATLESSLPHLSSPSSHSPLPPRSSLVSRPPSSSLSSRPSLRDAAARTIQARFRLFLVRRSQTLHYLKCLASIKSHAATLRSSLSDHAARGDLKALSKRATSLLLQLDSIQSGDPMIREGKRSISRELIRILEFMEKVLVKEHGRSLRAVEVAGIGGNGNEGFEEIARVIEDNEILLLRSTKPSKKVSFFENGRGTRVSAGAPGTFLEHFEEPSNVGHQRGNVERLNREVTGTRIAEHLEPEEGVSELSDVERSSEGGSDNGDRHGTGGNFRGENGNLGGLSAPLPVHMEPRRRE